MSQGALFTPPKTDWKPPEDFPKLEGRRVYLDVESTGKGKKGPKPVGYSVNGRYYPFAHQGGGNLDKGRIYAWLRDELRGKTIVNLNTGGDAEWMRDDGLDLEELGCTLHDVAHSAALLNENRFGGFNLDDIGFEYAHRHKLDCPVPKADIHKVHSSLVGPYAEEDTALVRDVDLAQRPLIEAEELGRVEALEDELIWANNHMERSGMRLDMPKLQEWIRRVDEDYSERAIRIWSSSGVKMKPNAQESWGRLFDFLGIPRNKTGEWVSRGKKEVEQESYTDDFLKKVDHPLVRDAVRMRRLSSLKSKYLEKYFNAQKAGILYYSLYQLRAAEEDYGTVVGRYSSANVNIQQVFKPTNQWEHWCDCGCPKDDRDKPERHRPDCFGLQYIIRELMIPDDGFDFFSVDGSQLQFRLFAHYSRDPDLIGAYVKNPKIDFHKMVAELFEMSRQAAKHNNFALVLGMGREKLANRRGLSCQCQDEEWWSKLTRNSIADRDKRRTHVFGDNKNHASNCPARKSNDDADEYGRRFPAAKALMDEVSALAEERGWIKTLLGRRRRYSEGDRFYSALAGLLQGSEADMIKSKINTLYKERATIGIHKLRATVHDEMDGDIDPSPAAKTRLEECCAEAELPLKVPMIWNAEKGRNWAACK